MLPRAFAAFVALPGIAVVVTAAFHLRVVIAEESWAARNFGAEWDA